MRTRFLRNFEHKVLYICELTVTYNRGVKSWASLAVTKDLLEACCGIATTYGSKMDASTMDSENSSSPSTYQCIACQKATVSLSCLHRHQTYRHTPEELSLSIIGLQCLLINNIQANNSIVYDNSWLCDPLRQAEFYTVSAKLLSDCNNNDNDLPVNYVIENEHRIFKEEHASEMGNEGVENESFVKEKACVFDSGIDCNFGRAVSLDCGLARLPESLVNVIQAEESRAIDLEADPTSKSLEKVIEAEESIAIDTEKVIDAEESEVIDTAAVRALKSSENVIKVEESNVISTEIDPFLNCVEGLCSELENIKRKPQKRKRTSPRNSAPKRAKTKAKPRVTRKKTKTINSVSYNNTVEPKTNEECEIFEKTVSASIDRLERNLEKRETESPVKINVTNVDTGEGRLKVFENKAIHLDTNLASSHCIERYPEKMESEIPDQQGSTNKNSSNDEFVTHDIENSRNQDFTNANPVKMKSEIEEQGIPVDENFANTDCPEIPLAVAPSTAFTFPWYPPDIDDYSILVLDPEAHQLVWTSVAIADEPDEQHNETLQETPVLPELTEADLQDCEIRENMTISLDSRSKESSGTSTLQSQKKKHSQRRK